MSDERTCIDNCGVAFVLNARTAASHATGKGVRVGVIDSGWDRTIANERVVQGIGLVDFNDELRLHLSTDDDDRHGHGTCCSNLVLDLAPDSTIVPMRVFGRHLETSPDVLARAIGWACEQSLLLLNVSLGTTRADVLKYLYAACERARRAGVIIVAAASAEPEGWSYPAVFEPVIGVGSASLDDPFDIEFTVGRAIECRLHTRGRRVRGLGSREYVSAGTSFAAPVVTGLIACWLELDSTLDVTGVRERFAQLGRP
ncbi:MAG: S8 family serine peptidase [Gemmatimonadaceae bacterium]